jgi:uncharacterized protein YbaA (DUF1428 family)
MSYIEGFLVAVPEANKQKYIDHAKGAVPSFRTLGATRLVEGWGDNVPEGEVTDYRRAVKAENGEAVIFGFTEWESKQAYDEAMPRMRADDRMPASGSDMPLDGKRLIFGGFVPIVDSTQE